MSTASPPPAGEVLVAPQRVSGAPGGEMVGAAVTGAISSGVSAGIGFAVVGPALNATVVPAVANLSGWSAEVVRQAATLTAVGGSLGQAGYGLSQGDYSGLIGLGLTIGLTYAYAGEGGNDVGISDETRSAWARSELELASAGEESPPYGPNPQVSERGVQMIAQFEGFSSQVYRDPTGNPTIGFGHLVTPGEAFPNGVTAEQAMALLRSDMQMRVEPYLRQVGVALSPNQVDALGSFVYNVGGGNFTSSTLLSQLNAGNYAGAAAQFSRWVYSRGLLLPGLVSRRTVESALFLSP